MKVCLLTLLCFAAASAAIAAENVFDPCSFGAKPDGVTLCTEPIQKAIDACSAAGGGTVRLAGGRFLSGTIHLQSHVTIEIAAGAILLGSESITHYPANTPGIRSYSNTYADKSLIVGEGLHNVALVGRGLIDGQGGSFKAKGPAQDSERNRPFLIRLVNCQDVLVEGLRLKDSAMWMQHYLGCDRVVVRGIHVSNLKNRNNDGIDLDGCKDCVVSGCVFESDDDGITLKSTCERACENVTICNCIARSHCNAIKMGTESNGGFKNIAISNCVVTSLPDDIDVVYGVRRGLTGVALELVDGGTLENVVVSNVVIDGVTTPLFLRLGNRARPIEQGMPKPDVGSFHNVLLSNIVATRASKVACSITGVPGHMVEDVQLNSIKITCEGGGKHGESAAAVPENEAGYPECMMFGANLPAYGFYCRHVAGLKLRDVQLRTEQPDTRPAIVGDDVESLVIDGLDVRLADGVPSAVRLIRCPGVVVRNSGDIPVETGDGK